MKDVFLVLRGELCYAKVLGDARPHTGLPKYDKGPFWSLDLTPDAKTRALLAQNGLNDKLRDPSKKKDGTKIVDPAGRTETYISLKVLENRKDGKKNKAPEVKDASGQLWDDRLLGNGTVADVKVKVVDYGSASEKGVYLQAIRVLRLVPYERNDFEPLSEDDEFFAAAEDQPADEIGEPEPESGEDEIDDDPAK